MSTEAVAPLLTVLLTYEHDVVVARQRARQIAALLGFEGQDQTRLATAVSEIARNAFTYAGGGTVAFLLEGRTAPQVFTMRIADRGPGIKNLPDILAGGYRSATGMGLGISGARRLMDKFLIESTPGGGTTVWLKKLLPRHAPLVGGKQLNDLADAVGRQRPWQPLEEVQQQNQELLRALDELRTRQEELIHLTGELEDTNRGVVALYAELDEKADHLRRADEMKTRFLSNMSHEFRTPLNSITALSRLLLDGTDGELTGEQRTQVGFIRKAANDLTELVDDLLDLAKVEAGKIVVRPVEFEVGRLFGALRGMLRPLLVNESVGLVFEEPGPLPVLETDEAKVSQILRNLVSNALKFTERGEVRVSAALTSEGDAVAFTVADTGIGIALEDQARIFEEFSQVDSSIQKKVRGTGLGLPLTKKLTDLLGGRITVRSQPGVGSTFRATIPLRYVESTAPAVESLPPLGTVPVLVVEDSPEEALLYEKFLKGSSFHIVRAATLGQARQVMRRVRPHAIILDIRLRGEDTWGFLAELKADEATRAIPVIVATSVDDPHKGVGLGADAYALKPVARLWLLDTLAVLIGKRPVSVLVVDDDPTARYLLRSTLPAARYRLSEVTRAAEAPDRASAEQPDVIVLDLVMPDLSGFDVLEQLKAEPRTRDIPVIVMTSKMLQPDEQRALLARAVAVLPKEAWSLDRVQATIEQALNRSPSSAEAPG